AQSGRLSRACCRLLRLASPRVGNTLLQFLLVDPHGREDLSRAMQCGGQPCAVAFQLQERWLFVLPDADRATGGAKIDSGVHVRDGIWLMPDFIASTSADIVRASLDEAA